MSGTSQDRSFVRQIAEGVFPHGYTVRVMATFRGYCDESEETNSEIVVVAGLIAPTARWERFETDWKLVLASYGIDYFHAVEFYHSDGPWKRGTQWDAESYRASFIAKLLSVVQALETKPDVAVVSLVWKKDYKLIFPKHDIVKMSVGTAYTVGCTGCWWLGAKWMEEQVKSEKICFFFDDGHEHIGDAAVAYQKAKNYPPYAERYKMGGIIFTNDKDFVPLQAADLLAYGVMRNMRARGYPLDANPIIRDFTGNQFPHNVLIANGDYLRTIRREHVRLLRQRGRKGVVD